MSHMKRLSAFYPRFHTQAVKYLGKRLRISREQGIIEDHVADYLTIKIMASNAADEVRSNMLLWGHDSSVAECCASDITEMSVNYYLGDFNENPNGCISRNLRWCYRFSVSQIGAAGQEPVERSFRSARTPRELKVKNPVTTLDITQVPIPEIESLPSNAGFSLDEGLALDQFELFVRTMCKESNKSARRVEKMIDSIKMLRGDWRKVEIAAEWENRGWAKSMNSAKAQVAYAMEDLRYAWDEFAEAQ